MAVGSCLLLPTFWLNYLYLSFVQFLTIILRPSSVSGERKNLEFIEKIQPTPATSKNNSYLTVAFRDREPFVHYTSLNEQQVVY